MDQKRLVELISKNVQGTQTEKEAEELSTWINESDENYQLYDYFQRKRNVITDMVKMRKSEIAKLRGKPDFDNALDEYYSKSREASGHPSPVVRRIRWSYIRLVAAVSLIFVIGLGIWKYGSFSKDASKRNLVIAKAGDLLPGGDKAILTLSDGKKIVLDKTAKGQIASQGIVNVIKNDSASVSYSKQPLNHKPSRRSEEEQFNVIETPRGGQYQVVLPDGTKVWLDAASSIRFPVSFPDNERLVTVTGQVFFEVSKDKDRPFKVNAGSQIVEVLGTDFNVRAYQDEEAAIKTTLLNGSIRVLADNDKMIVRPGEATIFRQNQGLRLLTNIDTGDDIAWTKGQFEFNRASIETVMGELSRWYDVKVVYEGKPARTFSGEISRNNKASDVLAVLKASGGVDFKIEGNVITVLK
jgi:transmembrane sensor